METGSTDRVCRQGVETVGSDRGGEGDGDRGGDRG